MKKKRKKRKVLVSKQENWVCLRYFMLVFGTHYDWFMGLGTACADSSEHPAFTLQAWSSSTVNRLKWRDGWVNNCALWLAITFHLRATGFPSSQPPAPPERWGFPYLFCSQMQRCRDGWSCLQPPRPPTLQLRPEMCIPFLDKTWDLCWRWVGPKHFRV